MATTPPLRKLASAASNHVSAGRKGDGAIEFDGRLVGFCAHPFRAQRLGQAAMRGPTRGNIDVALPRVEDFDGEMRGRTEAEQSDALSGLDSGDAQAAKADDSGT